MMLTAVMQHPTRSDFALLSGMQSCIGPPVIPKGHKNQGP